MKSTLIGIITLVATSQTAWGMEHADSDFNNEIVNDWQHSLILEPSENIKDAEIKNQSVFIYQGLTDKTIEQAMDEQFERIEHMMFVNTIVTDQYGQAMINDITGEKIVESDDC